MPPELVKAVEKAVERREGMQQNLKAASADLTEDLRNRSRTRGKGGTRLMPHKEPERNENAELVSYIAAACSVSNALSTGTHLAVYMFINIV